MLLNIIILKKSNEQSEMKKHTSHNIKQISGNFNVRCSSPSEAVAQRFVGGRKNNSPPAPSKKPK